MPQMLVLHGPNLNLLGEREPGIYGHTTLSEINASLEDAADRAGITVECLQSNQESALVDRIQAARSDGTRFILINPAAYTHTSIAIRDALAAVDIPFIEVHLSNPYAREAFRRQSYFSDLARGVICGFGAQSYTLAFEAALAHLHTS
jgi:3-dehydroquinate dehydratase-2